MKTGRKYFYLWSILINFLFGCRKEIDTTPPVISISLPSQNQSFQEGEGVVIKGTVSDETALVNISIKLLNEQGQPVHKTLSIPVSSKEQNINTSYFLDNVHLESGTYQLCLFASDGKNDSYTCVSIYIVAVPRILDKIMVATVSSAAQTRISTIDSSGIIVPFTNFPGDHLGLSVNSYFQELFHCGNATGNFSGMNIKDKKMVVDIPCVPSSSVPYFTGFYVKNNQYYVSNYNEQIRGYDHTGNIIYNATALLGYLAKHACLNDQHLIVEEQNKINKEQKLVCYYPTGVVQQNCSLTQEVVAFCEMDDAHVMVFGNKGGQGMIQEYDRNANNLWDPYPYTLTYGTITSVLQLDGNSYLLACSNGSIYKYVYSSSSVTSYLTGYTAIQMMLDDLNNKLYVIEKNKINTFDLNGKLLKTINSPEEILEIGLLYNR